ncbi:hypothetical protein [Methanosarcina sp.]|uniref:hypothetical protein n=1 Tax=Methanosarcina sp. TaxID=2213 RepID=UPI003C794DF5
MIRKVYSNNSAGTLIISVPAKFTKEMGLTKEDNVNIELVGKALHVSKVILQ